MLTHAEKIAAVAAAFLLLAVVVAWLFDRYVLVVSWWPLVGRQWRAERRDTLDLPGPEMTLVDGPRDYGQYGITGEDMRRQGPGLPGAASTRGAQPLGAGELAWDDEPSTDDDADAMIAAWRGDEDPTRARFAGQHGSDRATSQTDASSRPAASGEEYEGLAAVHPIYLDLSDDPDLIVWDAKQQADRCWEIVHVEFPRLRAELAGMWEAAA